jgi:hypothetical protein
MTRRRYSNRPRRTTKASGAKGWYNSPEWKARKARLEPLLRQLW